MGEDLLLQANFCHFTNVEKSNLTVHANIKAWIFEKPHTVLIFTEFTEATGANDDTDGISRHRLSPYTAYSLLITNTH